MRAEAKQEPVGPILVTWRRFPDPHAREVMWVCEDITGAPVLVTGPETAKRQDVEEFLASGPDIELLTK